jgi:AcrR family transcriptional regulator
LCGKVTQPDRTVHLKLLDPSTKPLRADAARNLTAILRAARTTFEEEGIDVGVDEVARRAGVGKGTLYRRFPTKESLVWAVMEDAVSELEELLDTEDADEPRDAWERFEAFMESAARFQVDNRGFFEAVVSLLGEDEPPEHIHERALAVMGRQLERAQEAGVVRPDLAAADIGAVLKMIGSCQPQGAALPEELRQRYLRLLLDGLRAGAGGPLPGRPPELPGAA